MAATKVAKSVNLFFTARRPVCPYQMLSLQSFLISNLQIPIWMLSTACYAGGCPYRITPQPQSPQTRVVLTSETRTGRINLCSNCDLAEVFLSLDLCTRCSYEYSWAIVGVCLSGSRGEKMSTFLCMSSMKHNFALQNLLIMLKAHLF